MKRLVTAIALMLMSWTALTPPVWAANLTNGAQIFEAHCSGCHVNGGNIIRRGKNLKLKALRRNQMDSLEAIAQIVTNGKRPMAAYGDRLTLEEIEDVSAYVLEQAEKDWK
jgi:cytochrome c6